MKKIVVMFSVMSSLVLPATSAQAQNLVRLRVDVPFNFIVNDTELPAGAYAVEQRDATIGGSIVSVSIRNRNGQVASAFMRKLPDRSVQGGALRFARFGNAYVLSAVSNDGSLSVASVGKARRNLLAQRRAPDTTIAALK